MKTVDTNKTFKVAISGDPGVGKDSFFMRLSEVSGRPAQLVALGNLIKDELTLILGMLNQNRTDEYIAEQFNLLPSHISMFRSVLSREEIENQDGYKKTPGVRQVLQDLGATTHHMLNETYWTDMFEELLKQTTSTKVLYGSTGCRKPGEVDLLRRYGFITVRLLTSETENCLDRIHGRDGYRPDASVFTQHVERALDNYDKWDIVVINDTWEQFEAGVQSAYDMLSRP